MAVATASGCDFYSFWPTDGADIAATTYGGGSSGLAAGTHMSFVGRYVYNVFPAELAELRANNISVFFFYENSGIQPSVTSNYLQATTYVQGIHDAQDAQANLTRLGISTRDMPVYFAIDYDAGASQLFNINAYFLGIQSVMGINTGMYGNGFIFTNTINPKYFCQSRSTGWAGNGAYITGQTLWQWPPGFSPSGNVSVAGHAVDGEFAYAADFGQYPRPGAGGGGGGGAAQLNVATLGSSSTIFSPGNFLQPTKRSINTADSHDQVIFSTTQTTTVTNGVGLYSIAGPATNIAQGAYPIGNFSYDGGLSWNDFGFIFATDIGSFVGALPVVVVQPVIGNKGGISFEVAVNGTVGAGGTIPLIIHIALLATPNPAPLPSAPSVTQFIAYSSDADTTSGTYSTYRRIDSDNTQPTGSATKTHNSLSVPNLMFWTQDTSNEILINPVVWSSTGAISGKFGLAMDSKVIKINVDASLKNCFYRLYKDN